MIQRKYEPINCDFHDRLESWAVLHQPVSILHETERGPHQTEGLIKDFVTREDGEFMLLTDGTEIRLDCLLAVNGISVPGKRISEGA